VPGVALTHVDCSPDGGGWTCQVSINDEAGGASRHVVTVSPDELARIAPGAAEPTDLVERSFAFLLVREPASSILPRFAISIIGRYFPEYEPTIRPR
jgi:hypothetical protein